MNPYRTFATPVVMVSPLSAVHFYCRLPNSLAHPHPLMTPLARLPPIYLPVLTCTYLCCSTAHTSLHLTLLTSLHTARSSLQASPSSVHFSHSLHTQSSHTVIPAAALSPDLSTFRLSPISLWLPVHTLLPHLAAVLLFHVFCTSSESQHLLLRSSPRQVSSSPRAAHWSNRHMSTHPPGTGDPPLHICTPQQPEVTLVKGPVSLEQYCGGP